MKPKSILLIVFVIVGLSTIYYSFYTSGNQEAYLEKITKARQEKDHYMRTNPASPFVTDSIDFLGLNYFDPNLKYRIQAKLNPIQNKKPVSLPTSDGTEKTYVEYAYAEFALEGKEQRLLILEIIDRGPYRGTLFLAFGDATSAQETYGAGRYLDVKKTPGSSVIILEFNEAYNPYCVYSDSYSCPFPPQGNLLTIPIRAGEKVYKE